MNEEIYVCEECEYSETKKYTLPNLVYCTKKQEFKEKREFCSECEKRNRNIFRGECLQINVKEGR